MMKCWLVASARTAAADRLTSRPNHGLRCVTAVLAVAAWVWLASSPAGAQTPGAAAVGVKIEQMLKATGFAYKTHNPITWSIEFERTTIGKFRVIISNSEDIIVTFTTVTEKAKIRKTPQLMEALLAANHEYDYAKIGLDKDGDLFVRIDSPVRVTDSALLKSIIEQVANASGEIFTKSELPQALMSPRAIRSSTPSINPLACGGAARESARVRNRRRRGTTSNPT